MFERVHAALSNSENLHVRLSDAEVHMIVTKFFTSLGKQVFKIMAKIETRLAQIEEFKEATFSRIQQIAKQTFTNDLEFEIYGSMATKLAIDTSDMDIAIYGIMN
jgi:DNA polymerase sigma